MKKLIVFFILFFAACSATLYAQIFVSGGIGFNTSSQTYPNGSNSDVSSKSTYFSFYPKAGYFLTKKFVLGLGMDFYTSKSTTPNYSEGDDRIDKSSGWMVAPFVRYYVVRVGEFAFFGEGSLGLGGGKNKTTYGSTTTVNSKYFDVSESIAPMLSYNLSKKLALELGIGSIGASTSFYQDPDDSESKRVTTSFGINLDLQDISFGLTYAIK